MAQETRNDEKARRLIDGNYAEGVSPENITRLLNYHFDDVTYQCDRDSHNKSTIKRVPQGSNYAPAVIIWTQP